MLTFLQRWKVLNALYHLTKHRDGQVWVAEHDLCEWIAGTDIRTHRGKTTFFENSRYRFSYFLFRVRDHAELYQKIRNVIYDCEHVDPVLIRRTKGDNGISDHLCLSPRGNEVYAISYFWLTSVPAQKVWTAILAGLVIWFTTWRVEQIIPTQPQKVQIELSQPTTLDTVTDFNSKG